MAKCTFCGKTLIQGRGKMFVKVSGDALYFCESKCQKNWNLGRQGKDFKWTKRKKNKSKQN